MDWTIIPPGNWRTDTCHNMTEPWKGYTKRSWTQKATYCQVYMNYQQRIRRCLGLQGEKELRGNKEWLLMGQGFWEWRKYSKTDELKCWKLFKNSWNVYFKRNAHIMACELYPNYLIPKKGGPCHFYQVSISR